MGLFGKLFEKKECAICGGEIGLLGNRKLEDGNMCKACAAKLSPWFDERRHSTVAQIEEQLEYREANKENVAGFRTTLSLGETAKVLVDEDAGRFMVTSARNYSEANPDMLELSDITGCTYDIDEGIDEVTRFDENNEAVSYDPPRFTHSYNFYVTVYVNNPYFDDMRFKVNSRTVEVEERRGPAVSANPGSINLVIGRREARACGFCEPGQHQPRYRLAFGSRDVQSRSQRRVLYVPRPVRKDSSNPS
ncbi:DUF4428 domain-containing protein [Adlercreutzia equolifaciens]|uniref:DUF4428 domain-containing protein n=1 Tax=Adlercreutzia equolifaciens TaxID=446660 RepID=UPI0027BA1765|nr:DUF4428 domain-containing protein [Adlercreutzia equolifaciens]